MEFKDDEIKRLQLAAETEEKKRFLRNASELNRAISENSSDQKVPTEEGIPPSSEPQPEQKSSLKQIRTFQGDVASALKEQNESLVSIQKSQALKDETEQRQVSKPESKPWKTLGLLFGIILFIALGGGGGYWAYTEFKNKTALPVITIPENRFLPIRAEEEIDSTSLNKQSLITLIQERSMEADASDQRGGIIQLQLKKGVEELAPLLTTSEFLVLLESRAPASLVRAFEPLFMLGILGADVGRPFLLIRLNSFEQSFPGMLSWEINLRDDLLPIFLSEAELINVPSNQSFEDLTISNKDTRVLKDINGKTVLLYTFIDNEMLLLTNSENSLRSILNLIAAGKLSR